MINFPDNPSVGDAFEFGDIIFRCIQVGPVVWTGFPADTGIPDAPVDGGLYGRKNGAWWIVDKAAVGLGNADNTSDLNKPISTATAAALAGKEPTIVAGTAAQYWKGTKAWATLDKTAVGLPNVDNTADINKTVNSALFIRAGGSAGGTAMSFNWYDNGSTPAYLWGGDNANGTVYPPSRLRVGAAANADNANAVNGISGWNYQNRQKNPAYCWVTDGSGQDQYLTQPGYLSVAYAGNSGQINGIALQWRDPGGGSPSYVMCAWSPGDAFVRPPSALSVGYANNAGALGGSGAGYFINNASTALVNIRNNGTIQLIAGISGGGDFWWSINPSDKRLKKDIVPTKVDSLALIEQLRFVGFRFRQDMPWVSMPGDAADHPKTFAIDDGRFHPVGIIADEAELIEPEWIGHEGTYKQPHQYALLMSAMHAIQQLSARVKELEAR